MSFIWNRINIAPSICKCVCTNTAHIKHAVRSGYNHESKGLKKEQMDLFSLLFFFRTALLYCCIQCVFKVQDVLCFSLWSFANIHLQLFPSQTAVQMAAVTTMLQDSRGAIDFYWCRSSMYLCVAAGEGLFSTSNFDVSCFYWANRATRTSSSPDFGTKANTVSLVCSICSPSSVSSKRMCDFVSASRIGKVFVTVAIAMLFFPKLDMDVPQNTHMHISFTIVVTVPCAYLSPILSCTHLNCLFPAQSLTRIFYKKGHFFVNTHVGAAMTN